MQEKICHFCKRATRTYGKKIKIDLGHPTAFDLGFDADVCQRCINQMNKGLMVRAKTAKLVLAN
jgi:hypothetical protein